MTSVRPLCKADDVRAVVHRVEEVHSHHPRRGGGAGRDLGDRQGRGVGGQDRVLAEVFEGEREDRLLDVQVLHDRLDDHRGGFGGDVADGRGGAQPRVEGGGDLGMPALQPGADVGGGRLELAAVGVDEADRVPGRHRDLGDAAAHRARSHHADVRRDFVLAGPVPLRHSDLLRCVGRSRSSALSVKGKTMYCLVKCQTVASTRSSRPWTTPR